MLNIIYVAWTVGSEFNFYAVPGSSMH